LYASYPLLLSLFCHRLRGFFSCLKGWGKPRNVCTVVYSYFPSSH
jgi:hypothetical protein